MLTSLVVTIPPALFLVVLFGGGALFRRRNIDMDGAAPIGKAVFVTSKYAIVLAWAGMVAQSWGARLSPIRTPGALATGAAVLWLVGFSLLFAGRLGLGDSFRIGSAKETTRLRVNGLFSFSRNPMYLGVYATLAAAVLYTLSPAVLVVAAFIIGIHHRIVLAEEEHLRVVFGDEYADYCRRVRRYV
ncbi:MAG: isoprenylcysteine carboxylmethyltransferase family protein [Armatimonadota bacterium]